MLATAIASADALHVTDAMFQNDPANVGEHHIPTPTHNDDRNIQNIPDEVFEKYKNDVDIIFAGFPCQGFSAAGKKMDNDPRNTLFREFLRTAKIINPKKIPLNTVINYKLNQIGSDRVANYAAVFNKKISNCIIIDFGTATTFDVIKNNQYYGGLIFPGITLSMN